MITEKHSMTVREKDILYDFEICLYSRHLKLLFNEKVLTSQELWILVLTLAGGLVI